MRHYLGENSTRTISNRRGIGIGGGGGTAGMGGREGVGGSRRRATPLRWEESYAYVTRDVEERERNKQQSTSNDDE